MAVPGPATKNINEITIRLLLCTPDPVRERESFEASSAFFLACYIMNCKIEGRRTHEKAIHGTSIALFSTAGRRA